MDIKTVTEAKTLGEVLRFQAATRPDATAFLFEDRGTDYATFDRHASQVAQGLLAEGFCLRRRFDVHAVSPPYPR